MDNDYAVLVNQIIKNVGGANNISNVFHCYTRLRLNLKDNGLVDKEKLKKLPILGIQENGDQLQIIIGNDVEEVYKEVIHKVDINAEKKNKEKQKKEIFSLKGLFNKIIDGIVGSVIPALPMLIASGLLQAIILIIQQFNIVSSNNPTLTFLSIVADSAFYFMPVIIGGFAAQKFGTSIPLGAMIGGALIHPQFIEIVESGVGLNFLSFPVYPTSYSSTIFPIIITVWVMSIIEKFLKKYLPRSISSVLVPFLVILIITPLAFIILAPLGNILSAEFANFVNWFYEMFGFIAVGIFAAIVPWIVMVGLHVGTVPISLATIAAIGVDQIIMPGFLISNFAQGAACLAVAIKTKSSNLKSLGYTSAFSNFIPGISEPGMYGITLRYRTPMYGAMAGALTGGLYFGLTNVSAFQFVPPNVFALAAYVGGGEFENNLLHTIIGILICVTVTFIVTYMIYKPEQEVQK